jgi:hypothetical protein
MDRDNYIKQLRNTCKTASTLDRKAVMVELIGQV